MLNEYKQLGFNQGNTDRYLTLMGSIAALGNGSSRAFWAWLQDSQGFKKIFLLMMGFQLVLIGTFRYVMDDYILFSLYFVGVLFVEGGYFGLFPALTSKVYGNKVGSKLYGFIYFGFTLANIIQYIIANLLFEEASPEAYWIFLGITAIGFVTGCLFNEDKIAWS
jgi:hypothetical protein